MTVGLVALGRSSGDVALHERLAAVGSNTGNAAFSYALRSHIDEPVHYVTWSDDPAAVRERCRVLVVPEASAANPVRDYGTRATFIESVDRPVLVASVGAQARAIGDAVDLRPGTVRYLRSLAERCDAIGVRGDFSAEVLAAVGITNTTVVGCPSNLINADPTLGDRLAARLQAPKFERVVVTQGDQKRALSAVERSLMHWVKETAGAAVFQSGSGVAASVEGLRALPARDLAKLVAHLRIRPWFVVRGSTLGRALGIETRTFFSIREWLAFLAEMDLAIGTRIHGNILAAQAGVPGVCITHDSRTEELSRTIGIPSLSIATAAGARSLRDVVSRAGFDGNRYTATRAELARSYTRLFDSAGVALRSPVRSLGSGDR